MIPQDQLSRHPAKSVPTDANPRKTKKDGGGKGNWGRSGDEVQDCAYTLNNARRRSNSSSQGLADFHTKFETVEPEPVFDEQIHGHSDTPIVDANAVVKVESGTSSNDGETDQADVKY